MTRIRPRLAAVVASLAVLGLTSLGGAAAEADSPGTPVEPDLGRVEVTKVLLGDEVPEGAAFEICLIGPSPDATSHCATVVGAGTVSFDLAPGTYQLVETDPGEGYSVSMSDDTVVVVARYQVSASITNTYTAPQPTTTPPPTTQPPTTQPPTTQPPTTTTGPESQPPTTPPPPTTQAPTTVAQLPAGGQLPATGSDGRTAALAAAAVGLGAALTLVSRRRTGRGSA